MGRWRLPIGSRRKSLILLFPFFAEELNQISWLSLLLLALHWEYFLYVVSLYSSAEWLLHCLDHIVMLQL
uniref:Uncharacterized protein n=1 Tax=Medicago truncatula TaxID=3880 RepID=I3SWT5_MEDTR|nr:unknown [Medicago truncatula]